ncbi:MAG: hypothetical protein ABH842_04925 [Candidatus Micrarchaeota archaeon]
MKNNKSTKKEPVEKANIHGKQPPQVPIQKPQLTPEQIKKQEGLNAKVKEIEGMIYALRFYPVAVTEESKNSSLEKLEEIYRKENETVRHLILYMLHESLTASSEFRLMHTFDYFKLKNPNKDPGQLRMNVYRSMFNYHTSLEGIMEIFRLLGKLNINDDAAKLLTYHFSRLCMMENEANHMLRSAILKALGESESVYALRALMDYAEYTDNDRTFSRVLSALLEWDKRLDKTKMTNKEKDEIRLRLKDHMSRDISSNHYR